MGYLDQLYLDLAAADPVPSDPLAGAVLDFDPAVSMANEQSADNAAITNTGGYTADADALAKDSLERVQFDGTNDLSIPCPSDLTDYSAAVPFTIYMVYRSDIADPDALPFFLNGPSTQWAWAQIRNSDARGWRSNVTAGTTVSEDDTGALAPPGTIGCFAMTFYSLTQLRTNYETVGALQTWPSGGRDPSAFDEYTIGGNGSGGALDGDLFRHITFLGDYDQDIMDALLDTYVKSDVAGADLTAPSGGTIEFDFSPTHTGDFTSARDSSGNRIFGTLLPTGQCPDFERLDGGVHGGVGFSEANDESIKFTYPGSSKLSLCANGKVCVYVAFDWSGSGADSIFGFGSASTSSDERIYLTYNQFGTVTGYYRDDLGSTRPDSGGNGPTTGTAVVAVFVEYDNIGGAIVGAADSAEAMTTSQSGIATSDCQLLNVYLAADNEAQTTNLFDGVIRRLVIVEGADYDTTFAQAVLDSVTT